MEILKQKKKQQHKLYKTNRDYHLRSNIQSNTRQEDRRVTHRVLSLWSRIRVHPFLVEVTFTVNILYNDVWLDSQTTNRYPVKHSKALLFLFSSMYHVQQVIKSNENKRMGNEHWPWLFWCFPINREEGRKKKKKGKWKKKRSSEIEHESKSIKTIRYNNTNIQNHFYWESNRLVWEWKTVPVKIKTFVVQKKRSNCTLVVWRVSRDLCPSYWTDAVEHHRRTS